MSEIGKYIYGIINSDKELFFSSCKAIAGEDVYTIPYKGISAVVSDAEIADYKYLLKETVARYLLRHQMVIEKVMEEYNIIPMQLGTYASDEEEAKNILDNGYRTIRDMFPKIDGKIEVDVVTTWSSLDTVLKEAAEEEEIRMLKQALIDKKEGITVDDQMKIGLLIKQQLDIRRERCAREIEISLSSISQDHKTHSLMDDKMVLNMAFLIEESMLKDFEKRVEGLNNEFDERLNFKVVGPLPPYSFNTLEVKKIPFAELTSAKGKLNLDDVTTKEVIEKAYRRQAHLCHPDKNGGTPDAHTQFDQLNRSYKMLIEYYDGANPLKGEGPKKDVIIVKMKE